MNQSEVATALQLQANIEPSFTALVWKKLEEQNPDFFKVYHMRLRLKEQMTAVNYIVSQQTQIMQKSNGSVTSPPSNYNTLQPFAPLPQPASLQALASSATSSALTPTTSITSAASTSTTATTQGSAVTRAVTPLQQATTTTPRSSVISSTGGNLATLPMTASADAGDNMPYSGFESSSIDFNLNEDSARDDTPITEEIDTDQFLT